VGAVQKGLGEKAFSSLILAICGHIGMAQISRQTPLSRVPMRNRES